MLAQLLTLSVEELEKRIQQELEENPALEAVEEERVHIVIPMPSLTLDWDSPADEGDSEDWFETCLATPPMSLKAHVWGQLRLTAPPELLPIAEHLVELLDERGYLPASVEEVALLLNVEPEAVERTIELLHQCDPPGVGARTLQECLLLQLKALQADSSTGYDPELLATVHAVLTTGWDAFARGRWETLQRKLKLSPEMLAQVRKFVRGVLRPYPASDFESAELPYESAAPQEPDIIVRLSQEGLQIEIRGMRADSLRLSSTYLEQAAHLADPTRHYTVDEREHIRHYLTRARVFLQALQQRYLTLKRIMEVIAQRQYSFLVTSDARFLRPMTRVEIAQATGLHRSTVGRAVRNKWLQLPSGMMVRLDVFFDASYRTAMLIQQIL
ncbi:MAG: hypothetical protein RMK45_01695, partial [Armatimonadota bacterium]|nr:hypothetical protein [Armatimonadota bacterium]